MIGLFRNNNSRLPLSFAPRIERNRESVVSLGCFNEITLDLEAKKFLVLENNRYQFKAEGFREAVEKAGSGMKIQIG